MPVSTVDQFVEFAKSVFKVVEDPHAFGIFKPLCDGNFKGHGSIAGAFKGYPRCFHVVSLPSCWHALERGVV